MTPGIKRIFSSRSTCSSGGSSIRVPSRSTNRTRRAAHAAASRLRRAALVLGAACPPRSGASAAAPGSRAGRARWCRRRCSSAGSDRRRRLSISRKFASLGHTLSTSGERCAGARAEYSRSCEQRLDALAARRRAHRGSRARERRLDGGLRERVGRDDAPRQLDELGMREQRADARARERMRLGQGAQHGEGREALEPGGEARAAGPFDVGLIDHDDGLAVERGAHRLDRLEVECSCRWDCWASTGTRASWRAPGGRAARSGSRPSRARAPSGTSTTLGALDVRGHPVHAEGRRALQDRILSGAQINARQQVDGLVAAAAHQQRCRPARRTARPGARPAPAAAAPDSG